ncbi:MAG: PAS domain-containing protein [Gammaproteobacteria bacterium]|nr:PAS domain-containing protein [Gammaproteobacteria bacterium]
MSDAADSLTSAAPGSREPAATTVDKRLDAALRGSGMAWFERDLESGLVTGSPSCAEIFGLADPLGPWPFTDFLARIVPEDLESYQRAIELPVPAAQSASNAIRYRIRRPDGNLRHVEARYGDLREHDRSYRFGLVMDVTAATNLSERLQDNSALLDLAMESIDMVLWDRDLVSGTFRSSPNYGAFYGLEAGRTEWSFADFLGAVHPDDHAVLREAYADSVAEDAEYGPKYRLIMPGGTYRWLESKGRLHRDGEGRPVRLVGVTWDVSERRVSEDRLLRIANLLPGMVYQLQRKSSGDYAFGYISDGIRALCGLEPDSVRADLGHFVRCIHRDDRQRFIDSSEASARALAPWHEEFRLVDPSGTQRWVEGRAVPQRMPDGTVLWHGHIFDIAARKAAEHDLRDTKARLTMALAAVRMYTWHWAVDSGEVTSPQDLGEFFDLPSERVTIADIVANVHPAERERFEHALDYAVSHASDETVRFEFRVLRASAQVHLYEVRARAEFDGDGRLRSFLGVTVDVTDQRLADQERHALQDQLQRAQKMELLGLMTGGIAHDFNNILASILGYAELARRDADAQPSARQAAYVEEIRLAAARGAELVAQMLAFSRSEATVPGPAALADLLELAVKIIRPTFPASIDIVTEVAPHPQLVATTAVEIQQIVMNLCINARDAMPGKGRIVVSLEHRRGRAQACASCGHPIDGDFVVLTVADNGAGIDDQVRERIFEPLFTTKSTGRGTGLGLAMVHGIVHRGRGHITLDTAVGHGTRIAVYLPVVGHASSTRAAEATAVPDARPSAARAARILVVDDERAVGGFIGELLGFEGHSVKIESDPREALQAFRAAPGDYDLVVSDQTMPHLTGTELALRCKAIRADLPVILLTGHSTTVDATIAKDLGIEALLAKPVDTAALVAAIDAALARRADATARG